MPVVLRPPLWQHPMPTAAFLVLSLMAFGAGADLGGWWRPAGFSAGGLGFMIAARSVALRVEAGLDELVLVNWFQTVHLPWAEVVRCGSDENGLWVRLGGGSEFRASCFQHGNNAIAIARAPAKAAAAELERIRRQR